MRVVHKFNLNIGETVIDLPTSAKTLHVEQQYGQLQLWVETTPGEPTFERHYRVFGTGHPIDEVAGLEITYVGTALMEGGAFVAHVYQAVPDKQCAKRSKIHEKRE